MATSTFVLPGEAVDPSILPSHSKAPIKLGPGVRHIPPNTIVPVVAGQFCIDARKNAIWVEYNSGRYIPTVGDLIIATIHHSSVDLYYASISDYTSFATLPQLSFEGATKKTRPQLVQGSLVYARITLANKHMDPELECVSSSTGKSDGLGELKGGMLFDVSLGMARRLMMPKPVEQGKLVVLEELGGAGVAFEIAVGRNGIVWVDSKSTKETLVVGKSIQEADQKSLGVDEQRKLVRKMIKDL